VAHKKGMGSTRNGRDSQSKRLGAKRADGEYALAGNILVRQRGTKIHPGTNVGKGSDDTLYALVSGYVKYSRLGKDKKKVSIILGEKVEAKVKDKKVTTTKKATPKKEEKVEKEVVETKVEKKQPAKKATTTKKTTTTTKKTTTAKKETAEKKTTAKKTTTTKKVAKAEKAE